MQIELEERGGRTEEMGRRVTLGVSEDKKNSRTMLPGGYPRTKYQDRVMRRNRQRVGPIHRGLGEGLLVDLAILNNFGDGVGNSSRFSVVERKLCLKSPAKNSQCKAKHQPAEQHVWPSCLLHPLHLKTPRADCRADNSQLQIVVLQFGCTQHPFQKLIPIAQKENRCS